MIIDFRKYLKGKKALILGGVGFIGSNLARLLVFHEAEVTIIDNMIPGRGGNQFNVDPFLDKISLNISDVRDSYALEYLVKEKDLIFNCAALDTQPTEKPLEDIDINLSAQITLLEACRKSNPSALIIHTSSKIPNYPDVKQEGENLYRSDMSITQINKLAAEQYYLHYHQNHGLKTCILRLTNTFGPGMKIKDASQNYLGLWVKQVLEGKVINVPGDGEIITEQNYIDDVIEAFLLASVKSKDSIGEVFNLGARHKVSYKDLANMLIEIFRSGEYKLDSLKSEEPNTIHFEDKDYIKIRKKLGWESLTSLKSAIGMTLRHYEKYLAYY